MNKNIQCLGLAKVGWHTPVGAMDGLLGPKSEYLSVNL